MNYDRWNSIDVSDDDDDDALDPASGASPAEVAKATERRQERARRAAVEAASSAIKAMSTRLVLIASANDINSERLRWALSRHGRTYEERDAPYGLWLIDTLPFSRAPPFAQDTAVPLLLSFKNSTVVDDSSTSAPAAPDVFRRPMDGQLFLMAKSMPAPGTWRIYPSAAVATLEREIETRLITVSQTIATSIFVLNWDAARRCVLAEIRNPNTRAIYSVLWPIISAFLFVRLRLWDPESIGKQLDDAYLLLDRLEAEMAGKMFVAGDAFSAADIALACGLTPLLCAAKTDIGVRLGINLPSVDELPTNPSFPLKRDHVYALRSRPIGRHVMRLIARERGDVSAFRTLRSRKSHATRSWWASDNLFQIVYGGVFSFSTILLLLSFLVGWKAVAVLLTSLSIGSVGGIWWLTDGLKEYRDHISRLWFTLTKTPAPEPVKKARTEVNGEAQRKAE